MKLKIGFAGLGTALVLLNSKGAKAQEWHPPDRTETLAMAAAEVLIAIDIWQTAGLAGRGWPDTFYEVNPLLGQKPSVKRVVITGAAAGIAAAGLFVALPPRVRFLVPAIVGTIEATIVASSFAAGISLHF